MDFIKKYFQETYGLKKLVLENIYEFIKSLKMY
jgi:hypothetical protein